MWLCRSHSQDGFFWVELDSRRTAHGGGKNKWGRASRPRVEAAQRQSNGAKAQNEARGIQIQRTRTGEKAREIHGRPNCVGAGDHEEAHMHS